MNEQIELLEKRWRSLCDVFLPITYPGQPWRASRLMSETEPSQGWKLHISATILTACDVLARTGPVLRQWGALYKAPESILELRRINAGLFYGYSQVGKFMTIYPERAEDALRIAAAMDRLTDGLPCPRVPYDRPLRAGSCVSYRYGAFRSPHADGHGAEDPEQQPMIRTPDGSLVRDERTRDAAVPAWAPDPFTEYRQGDRPETPRASPLKSTYRAYEAISQRGKGGVYKAISLRTSPAGRCIFKEGRMNGETDWDGTDGFGRIRNEKRILELLWSRGIPVPEIVDYFEVGPTNYLVLESVEGALLHSVITGKQKLPIPEAVLLGAKMADMVAGIHRAGVVWRDCKPLNVIVDESRRLRPLDFEGACLSHDTPRQPWGTYGYIPPEWLHEVDAKSPEAEDRYALGASLHHLLSGRPPDSDKTLPPIGTLRRGIPPDVRHLIRALTDPDPGSRPAAAAAAAVLCTAAEIFTKPETSPHVRKGG